MPYAAINVEGGLFPADLLDDIAAGTAGLPAGSALGADGRRLTDDIQSAFSDARSYWDAFQRRLDRSNESIVTLTRQDWMFKFLELIGFGSLTFRRAALEAAGQSYNISHLAGDYDYAPPVHIVGVDQPLDQRDGRNSPHALVQEYLNRSDALWGLVGNGSVLRLLRDTARLFKPTYLEFNLEGMMEGNQYSEFALLYRLIHSSHFPQPEANAQDCGLEKYYQDGLDQGGRVREHLRVGVEECIKSLGTAFLKHPESEALRQKLSDGQLDTPAYYRQLLRLVYRFLFLMVAEERRLIFPEESAASPEQRVYRDNYSIGKLRDRAERYFRGDSNSDLWLGVRETFRLFRNSANARTLGLSALDGELFGPSGCPDLEQAHCRNEDLLNAIRHLSTFLDDGGIRKGGSVRRRVNYAALDVEELGSVYESLLDFHPQVSLEAQSFELVSGSERKQTGSYYTPPELVRELINSALVPVIDDRLKGLETQVEKETALLTLKVCDPASGSGHFLLAAARRIARELAQVRTGEQEPVPTEYRLALRDVIRNCVYAVDKNPLAVDLCKVALWIEGHNAGLPLSFLDHHIRHGDSLVGVFDLKVLEQGIPDDAYKPVTGDDKATAKAYLQRNKRERTGQLPLSAPVDTPSTMAEDFGALAELEERTPEDVQGKESLYASIREEGSGWWDLKVACDLWTSAFFLPMTQDNNALLEKVPTTGSVRKYVAQPASASVQMVGGAIRASSKQNFFHWPLEFPEVFENGGFDVVLGNPPWERIKLQEQEFFDVRDSEIAKAPTAAARKRLIAQLPTRNQSLANEFEDAKHASDATSRFIRTGGRFPLGGRGDINTYVIFAEHIRSLMSDNGRAGVIVPSGIATDDTTKHLFGDLVEQRALVSLYDFENSEGIFSGVHRSFKFCLLTLAGVGFRQDAGEFAFFLHRAEQLRDKERRFNLTSEDFRLLNPNSRTCPIFRTKRDLEITKSIYEMVPVLVDEDNEDTGNRWGVQFIAMFHMSNDSGLFRTEGQLEAEGWSLNANVFKRGSLEYLPLYEGRMIDLYDHRAASIGVSETAVFRTGLTLDTNVDDHMDPSYLGIPRYWVASEDTEAKVSDYKEHKWFLSFKDVTSSTNERTMVAAIIPYGPVGNTLPLIMARRSDAQGLCFLASNLSTFILDYAARQKVGGLHLNYIYVKQLPIVTPETFDGACLWSTGYSLGSWILPRMLELVYTAADLHLFAHELGFDGPPFRWDEERRFLLRCELDAAFFHTYGIIRDDVDFIMESFPIVKRRDNQVHGEYRTKYTILEIYDEMAQSMETGKPYQSQYDMSREHFAR